MDARLLVVDDDDVNREIIAEYLNDAGYHLIMAEGGETALRLMREAAALRRRDPGSHDARSRRHGGAPPA